MRGDTATSAHRDAAVVLRAADFLRSALGLGAPPRLACILGSGLGSAAEMLTDRRSVAYSAVPGLPAPTVHGHAGMFHLGLVAGKAVLICEGRLHLYEGHDPALVGLLAKALGAVGISTLFLANAAGGIRDGLDPGALMLITDHLNLMWRNPLVGPERDGEIRFPDMSSPYDAGLRELLQRCNAVAAPGERLHEGVYAGVLGPSYETPAEIRMLSRLGADAVGMSTIPEVVVARSLNIRCAAISCITNRAAGLSPARLAHEEVLAVSGRVRERMQLLLETFAARL